MAIIRLGDISTIQIGLILARKKSDEVSQYVYKLLTLKSLESNGINPEVITCYYSKESLQNEYLTKTGTIVMKLSFPFHPAVITKETEGFLIPSQMVSIKPAKPVLAEYLCLYLSQNFVAEYLLSNYFWIAQKSITVESLANLQIRIPPLKNQQAICEYHQTYLHLCALKKKLEKEEETMMKHIFSVLSKTQELP